MYPTLNLLLFTVSAYNFFTALALAVLVVGSYIFARKRGFKKMDTILMLFSMTVAAFVGARLFNILIHFDWYREDYARLFTFSLTGFSLYGGIIMAIVVGFLISVVRRIPLLKFADTVIPFVGTSIILMRIGCFLNGCCFGKETDLPWGVTYPPLSPAHIHQLSDNVLGSLSVSPVHPTQLYEMLAALIGTIFIIFILKNKKPDGTAFLVFGMWFSAFRWFNIYFRVLPYSDLVQYYLYPILYAIIIVICAYMLSRLLVKQHQ